MSATRRRRRASREWEGRDRITVAALPGRGVYVRHLSHPEGIDGVHRPTVPLPGTVSKAAVFDLRWLSQHLADVQLVHVHGVPPRLTPEEITAAAELIHAAGRPLVVTVYHLSDPTGTDDDAFGAQLAALLPRADSVITLTDSAREEILERWDVDSDVLPHPHVVDFVRMRRNRAQHRPGTLLVGAHLGSLRLPGDPVAVVASLAAAVAATPGAQLDVTIHDHLLDPNSTRYDAATIRRLQRVVNDAGGVLRTRRPFSDAQLWDYLLCLDASFVPAFHGSHSIWPEACYDLGTQTILPAGSHAGGQRPALTYTTSADAVPDPDSVRRSLVAAQEQQSGPRADPAERWAERVRVAETLRNLYEKLITARQ